MGRRLAAIMVTDVVEFSRMMNEDEAGTLSALRAHRSDLVDPIIAERGGRLVKLMGDGALVEFPSAVQAVEAALAIQRQSLEMDSQIRLRIGINLGDVVVEGDDIYGDGVNVAARLEALAEPEGICISAIVHQSVGARLGAEFVDTGEHEIKGQRRAVRVLRWPATGGFQTHDERPSVAILPFDNLSSIADDQYFSQGITDDIAADLSKISGLFVIARSATREYKTGLLTPNQAARELGVRYVLDGSVRRAGERIRINASLLDAKDSRQLWADRFDGDLEDLFDFQDRITENIVATLSVTLTRAEQQRAFRKDPKSLKAYDYVLQGNAFHYRFTKEDNAKALEKYARAIELDPDYAPAHAGLAWASNHQANQEWGSDPEAALDLALTHARQAVALDSSLAKARLALADVHCWATRQHDLAIAEGQRAVELEPSNAEAHFALAYYLITSGQTEAGMREIELALRYNPVHANCTYYEMLGIARYLTGHYELAVSALEEGLVCDPDYDGNHQWLAATYAQLGRFEEAKAHARTLLELKPHVSLLHLAERLPYKRKRDLEHLFEGLRIAGIPE